MATAWPACWREQLLWKQNLEASGLAATRDCLLLALRVDTPVVLLCRMAIVCEVPLKNTKRDVADAGQ